LVNAGDGMRLDAETYETDCKPQDERVRRAYVDLVKIEPTVSKTLVKEKQKDT